MPEDRLPPIPETVSHATCDNKSEHLLEACIPPLLRSSQNISDNILREYKPSQERKEIY